MENELIRFMGDWIYLFQNSLPKKSPKSIFKTKDARAVFRKSLNLLSKNFNFSQTSELFSYFEFPENKEEILKRQEFFKGIPELNADFLKEIKKPRSFWNPNYRIVVVTEEESTLRKLKDLGCNVKFMVTDSDVIELENYDIVQVIDCDNFSLALERLPQTVFLNSVEEAYLERYLRTLSGWKENLDVLKSTGLPQNLKMLVDELDSLSYLYDPSKKEKLSKEKAEEALEEIKGDISKKIKELNVSSDLLLEVLNSGKLPKELDELVTKAIRDSGMPQNIFIKKIPLEIDWPELSKTIRDQELNEFSDMAEEIKKNSSKLGKVPENLRKLEINLILFDFMAGIKKWMNGKEFPSLENHFGIKEAHNEFISDSSPITFSLDEENRCSMLTGANSGGKTTLLEHLIQIISYSYLGLPVEGIIQVPLFSEVYYFAKNKGSMSKGAFETLLTQMSEITPGKNTLILADEIEAVTEPGVAGKMISATAQYFIDKGCYLVFATHLGQEIQKILPKNSRIDGIEAKGLDEFNELIVDHNPVLGKLASSTPELIVEKMARTQDKEYFKFLNNYLKTLS